MADALIYIREVYIRQSTSLECHSTHNRRR